MGEVRKNKCSYLQKKDSAELTRFKKLLQYYLARTRQAPSETFPRKIRIVQKDEKKYEAFATSYLPGEVDRPAQSQSPSRKEEEC